MEMKKQPYPLTTVCKMQKIVDPTPDYQRPPAWSRKQKQLLMDTILRNYDIPKFYWRKVNRTDDVKYEVVDGQQRLRAIWEFAADEYALPKDADPIDGFKVAGLKHSQLPLEIGQKFDLYVLDVVVILDAVEDEQENEVRDMFLRLQNGTTLKAQEKRNAMTGAMRDFVKEIAGHPFFESCYFANSRYAFDHIAAQTVLIEMNGGPTNVRDADLSRMYKDKADFDRNGKVAKKVRRVFDFLKAAFPEKTPELVRYNVISLYVIASQLVENYVFQGLQPALAQWFIAFEQKRAANDELPVVDEFIELLGGDVQDAALIEYKRLTSQSTDTEESIRGRVELLEKRFFEACPNIEQTDPKRGFSHEQRLAIYRRDGGQCRLAIKCDGVKVGWDNWHADHITAHSKGGKTTVANGQLACVDCNLSKGAAA